MSKLLGLLLLLLPLTTSSVSHPTEITDHKVILFAGEYCSSDCYKENSKKKSCMWFKTGSNLPINISDLSRYSTSYTVYKTRIIARGEADITESNTYNFSWELDIHRIYIGNDYTKVILYTEEDFRGKGLEIWGRGCADLDRYGWANRAKSLKIVSMY